MDRLKVLVTVTDGVDNSYGTRHYYARLVNSLRQTGVLSLSCGIGAVDVDHHGLGSIAKLCGGRHIVVADGGSIARALADLTQVIHDRVGEISRIVTREDRVEIERLGFVARRIWRIPIDLLVLIDRSWSMLGMVQHERVCDAWTGDSSKLPNAKQAAIRLIQSLNPTHDTAGVASFCDGYSLLQRLTSDFQSCFDAIGRIDGGNGTSLYQSMYLAIEDLAW